MEMRVCPVCHRFYSSVYPENDICRKCLIEKIKAETNSKLPKHEKTKIEELDLKDTWLIPDKEKKHET